jgi:RNA polymerase sigma-70 factor (ECF subfamily)
MPDDGFSSHLATMISSRRHALVRQLRGELPTIIAEAMALHFLLDYTVEESPRCCRFRRTRSGAASGWGRRRLRKKLDRDRQLTEMLGMSEGGHQKVEAK